VSRPPTPPSRSEVAPAELSDYDDIVGHYEPRRPDGAVIHDASTPLAYFERLVTSPTLAASLSRVGRALHARLGEPGAYTPADHEFIDEVLSFDLGYWGLLAYHTPYAVSEGVRLEAIEALRHGRDEDLTSDEAHQQRFIRKVIAGEVADDDWDAMERRLGSERGVIEYAAHILLLQLHIRMHQLLGIPAIGEAEFDDLLDELRAGARRLPAPEKGRVIPAPQGAA
jgi:hypothetical protein